MKVKKRFQISLKKTALGLFVCGLLILTACVPQIEEFTPMYGREGTEIIITGKHFKNRSAENTVRFGNTLVPTSDIILSSRTKIIVRIPPGAKTGLISVTTSRGTGFSNENFEVLTRGWRTLSDSVEDELNKLAKGQILFNPPQEMKVGVKERVEVRIAKTITEDLTVGLRGRGESHIEEIRVGTFMRTRLQGIYFNIEELSEEDQLVAGEGFTQWNYNVTPLKSGIQSLSLTVTVRIKLPGNVEETKEIEVFDREISIHVNISYSLKKFIENYWWGITTAIIVPIVLLIIKIWWDSKKKIRRKTKKGNNR